MNQTAQTAIRSAVSLAGALGVLRFLERTGHSKPGDLHTLMYHRIAFPDDAPNLYQGLISATPVEFEQQMVALRRRHQVISVTDLLNVIAHDEVLPERAVLLTFDDAYRDFLDHAWPILKRLDLPAVLFVPTAFPEPGKFPEPGNRGFWWDRLHRAVAAAGSPRELLAAAGLSDGFRLTSADVYRRLRARVMELPNSEAQEFVDAVCAEVDCPAAGSSVLGWDELRTLAREGLTLGGHTRSHPLLDRVSSDEMRAEIAAGQGDLRREVGAPPPVFAYPGGACPGEAVKILEEQGFELAFTTQTGVANIHTDAPLLLPRIPVKRSITAPLLRAQLLPQFAHLNQSWRRRCRR